MATMNTTAAQAATKGLEDLFLDGLKDIYYEKKILKALPKMVKGAESEEVSAALKSTAWRPKIKSTASKGCSN